MKRQFWTIVVCFIIILIGWTEASLPSCISDDQCQSISSQYVCKKSSGQCTLKPLFGRPSVWDLLLLVTTFFASMLCSASGLGGGGLFVPLMVVLGRMSASLAIPLSKAMIFGAAIANVALLITRSRLVPPHQQHSPLLNRSWPVISFDVVTLLEPWTLLGTIAGVFLNIMLPEWLTLICLVILLSFTSLRTTTKAVKAFKKETEEQRSSVQSATISQPLMNDYKNLPDQDAMTEDEEDRRLFESEESGNENPDGDVQVEFKTEQSDFQQQDSQESFNIEDRNALLKIISEDASFFPIKKIGLLLLCWMIIVLLSLAKGGHGSPPLFGIRRCSVIYWFVVFLSFPIISAIGMCVSIYLFQKEKVRKRLNYIYPHGAIIWNKFKLTVYPALCVAAGAAAGCLGIGGGMIKAPILVEMGLPADMVSASSSFMILFTSSITTTQFLIVGRLPIEYGITFAINGFFSAFLGQLITDWFIKRFERPSILIFLIAGIIAVSTVFMGVVGLEHVIRSYQAGASMGFHPPC